MADYSKWDKLADSDDEGDVRGQSAIEEERERTMAAQEEMQQWLRRQMCKLEEEQAEKARRPPRTPGLARRSHGDHNPFGHSYGGFGDFGEDTGRDMSMPPELDRYGEEPIRKVTKEERKALAMFLVIGHFDDGETNLDRHPQMLDLVRHNRWLEEDPGTLELLCKIHLSSSPKVGKDRDGPHEDPGEARLRGMVLTGINTLAAAKKAGMLGGLLEMVTAICTPATDEAKEMRKKWQRKDYAKEAIFECMCPELKNRGDDEDEGSVWKDCLMFGGFIVLLIMIFALILYMPTESKRGAKGTRNGDGLKALFGAHTTNQTDAGLDAAVHDYGNYYYYHYYTYYGYYYTYYNYYYYGAAEPAAAVVGEKTEL